MALFVDHVLEAHREAQKQIILDLNATDDPLHGDQFSNRGVGAKALRTRFAISRENSPLATLA